MKGPDFEGRRKEGKNGGGGAVLGLRVSRMPDLPLPEKREHVAMRG